MSDYKNLNDQELEELRVKVRDEQMARNTRARIEGDLLGKLEEFANAGGDVQNVFEKFTAEPPADEPETDNDEGVHNVFDAPVKFEEPASPVLEGAETNKDDEEVFDAPVTVDKTTSPVLEAVETNE